MTFTENDKLKAMAIVHIFETSRPLGDYAACVVLNDGAGVAYGINQFTHRSGSLAVVVEAYLKAGGTIGREIFSSVLPVLKTTSPAAISSLAADNQFKRALRAAAVTREMKTAQLDTAFEKYLAPAMRICERNGFERPLSLAVVYDSVTHGSWELIAGRVGRPLPVMQRTTLRSSSVYEMTWITEYVRKRHTWLTELRRLRPTNYRTKFFLDQIATGNWDLRLPMDVHGYHLADVSGKQLAVGSEQAAVGSRQLAVGSKESVVRGGQAETPASARRTTSRVTVAASDRPDVDSAAASGPPAYAGGSDLAADARGRFTAAADAIDSAAEKFDRVDGVITTVTSRTDAAKSLWTTVGGTIWQSAWAVFGFVVGLPKVIWLVAALIAAALMLAYLYRQITLAKIRETARASPGPP